MGGNRDCEGAILLQDMHSFLVLVMSVVIPGQNTEQVARDSMEQTP